MTRDMLVPRKEAPKVPRAAQVYPKGRPLPPIARGRALGRDELFSLREVDQEREF